MKNNKYNFINNEFLTNSVSASFQRSNIYNKNAPAELKKLLRKDFKNQLSCIADKYKSSVSELEHCAYVQKICDELTEKYKHILIGSEFRYGIAQKGLNLYLKYLWCLGQINEPPHCPVDRIVLEEAKIKKAWTRINSADEYKKVIAQIKNHINGINSLSCWELETWNRRS